MPTATAGNILDRRLGDPFNLQLTPRYSSLKSWLIIGSISGEGQPNRIQAGFQQRNKAAGTGTQMPWPKRNAATL